MTALRFRWPAWASLPLEIQFSMGRCAIAKVKIDEALVRNAHVFRNGLEVTDAFFVQANGDLLLKLRSVGVLR